MVCKHGTVDAARAKFGYPLYKYLRKNHASDELRVWRVSHFGGHVFAPTLMDMPLSHYWAYVEEEQAAQIIQRSGNVRDLRGHYRGWAGLDNSFLQAAEREMWQCEGWDWFAYQKFGQIKRPVRKNQNGVKSRLTIHHLVSRAHIEHGSRYKSISVSFQAPIT